MNNKVLKATVSIALASVLALTAASCGKKKTTEHLSTKHITSKAELKFKEATYTWDGAKCSAIKECITDSSKTIKEEVTAKYEVIKKATCKAGEEGKYVATFTNSSFTKQEKTVVKNELDPNNHTYVGDICSDCGAKRMTPGLKFEYNAVYKYYRITDYEGTSDTIRIQAKYDDGVNGEHDVVIGTIGSGSATRSIFADEDVKKIILEEGYKLETRPGAIGVSSLAWIDIDEVVIEGNVTDITVPSLFSKSTIKKVVIPNGVKNLDLSIFEAATIDYLELPNTLTNMYNTFEFTSIKEIKLNGESEYYSTKDGDNVENCLIDINNNKLLLVTSNSSYQFNSEIKEVEKFAFSGLDNKEFRIYVPRISQVNDYAFAGAKCAGIYFNTDSDYTLTAGKGIFEAIDIYKDGVLNPDYIIHMPNITNIENALKNAKYCVSFENLDDQINPLPANYVGFIINKDCNMLDTYANFPSFKTSTTFTCEYKNFEKDKTYTIDIDNDGAASTLLFGIFYYQDGKLINIPKTINGNSIEFTVDYEKTSGASIYIVISNRNQEISDFSFSIAEKGK